MRNSNSKYTNLKMLAEIFLAGFIFACLSGTGVVNSEVYAMYEFKPLFLPHNEKIEYVVRNLQSDKNGEASITIRKITQMDMDILLVNYEGTEGDDKTETWQAKLRCTDLTPITFDRKIEEGEYSLQVNGSFMSDSITINIRQTGQEPREILFSRGTKFQLSIMTPYLLRNIEYATGDWYTYNMLLVEEGQFMTPIIQVKDKEVIECPAGLYECWKVSVKEGENQHWAWYSVKEPHYLIQYQYSDKELTMKRHF